MRVPTTTVSCIDLTFSTENKISAEDINEALSFAANWELKWILWFEQRPLVSYDYRWNTHSSIVDAALTQTIWDNFWKVVAWYDNEFWYATRLIDLAIYINDHI